MNKAVFYLIKTFGIVSVIFCLFSCNRSNSYHSFEGLVWNTSFHITYEGDPGLQDSVFPLLEKIGKSLSVFDRESLVSKVNSNIETEIDFRFEKIYLESKRINEISHGLFDPTVSPIVNAWGFGINHTPSSDTLRIDSLLQFTGINKTRLENGILIKEDARTQFNFSAIAKGYACDEVGEMLKRNRVENYLVEIGGEIALHGKSPSGTKWRVSIDAPIEETESPSHESAIVVEVTDMGIATSGNYRNFRIDGGTKLYHTISPQSGRPAVSDVISATVLAPTCMEADAIATACMAAGSEMAKDILKNTSTEGMLILQDSIYLSPGFEKYISGAI